MSDRGFLSPIVDACKALSDFVLSSRPVMKLIDVFDRRADNCMCERGMIRQAFEFKSINAVKGDYFEFGLWRGKTFRYAHWMKRRFRQDDTMIWGFDSFEGLPDIDDAKDNIWTKGTFSCSEPEFRRLMRRSRIKESEYQLVKGFYETSLNEGLHQRLANRKVAIAYIDCDLYTSTKVALDFVHRYFTNGTILCFDDFYNYKGAADQGEQRALIEFTTAHPEFDLVPYFNYCPLGKSFIVRVS